MIKISIFIALIVATSTLANTDVLLRDIRPKISAVMEYESNRNSKTGSMYEWRIPGYLQADTGFRVFVDEGYITDAEYDFYLGFDTDEKSITSNPFRF